MKRNYIIPATESVAFRAGFICQAGSPGAGMDINSNAGIGMGGNSDTIDPN